jgi:hypothetical protein
VEINFVQQKENGCVLACIAMMTNIPLKMVEDAYPEFDGIGLSTIDTIRIFNRLGYEPIQYVNPIMFPKRLYMCGIASLNNLGGLHAIVVYCKSDGTMDIYDPLEGIEGKLIYGNKEENIKLKTYTDVIELVCE